MNLILLWLALAVPNCLLCALVNRRITLLDVILCVLGGPVSTSALVVGTILFHVLLAVDVELWRRK